MSIKLHEIRVGNWIYSDNLCEACQVDTQVIGMIDFTQNEMVRDSDFSAIQITPQILVSSGFNATERDESGYLGLSFRMQLTVNGRQTSFTLEKYNHANEYQFEHYFDESSRIRPHQSIQFVHQLQNLYFALYGEELNIVL